MYTPRYCSKNRGRRKNEIILKLSKVDKFLALHKSNNIIKSMLIADEKNKLFQNDFTALIAPCVWILTPCAIPIKKEPERKIGNITKNST